MPFLAPMPVPTATAVGVARPSASGQAITTAVTASVIAKRAVCPITKNQMRNVSSPALFIGTDQVGLRGCEPQQGIERIGGTSAAAHLHPVTEQNEGHEHSGSVITRLYLRDKKGGKDAEEVRDQHTQAHQYVHIECAITQGTPCAR